MKLVRVIGNSPSELLGTAQYHYLKIGCIAYIKRRCFSNAWDMIGESIGSPKRMLVQTLREQHIRKIKCTKKNLRAFAKQFR